MRYEDIKTPKELFDFMNNNIEYGYLGKSGRVYHFNDKDFNEKWKEEYILEDSSDILKTKVGNCFDQVELERDWFSNHNYEFKTIYHQVLLDYSKPKSHIDAKKYINFVINSKNIDIMLTKVDKFQS